MSVFDPSRHFWAKEGTRFVQVRGRLFFWRRYLYCYVCGHRERVR